MNMRPMPKSLDEHKLINDSQGQVFDIFLVDDPIKEGKKIQKIINEKLKNPIGAIAGQMLQGFAGWIMPNSVLVDVILNTSHGFDIYMYFLATLLTTDVNKSLKVKPCCLAILFNTSNENFLDIAAFFMPVLFKSAPNLNGDFLCFRFKL